MASRTAAKPARTTISVQGARVHNLKNVSLEIPRDSLVVVTGLSGSGKSSLAFDTIYAEGQRRYMESLSSYAKRFVAQVAKPDVDFVFGLSPVISIEQKTVGVNPRSTVGTMTDIASYLNLLYATIGQPHCPRTGEPVPSRSSSQILEGILSLPEGTEIELRAPAFRVYGEELDFVFTELRKKGCRRLIVDGKQVDISEEVALDESRVRNMDAIVDRFVVSRKHEKAIKAGIASALLVGDGLMQVQVIKGAGKAETERFYGGLCSRTHHLIYGDIGPSYFVFNDPESACRTCGGLGVDKLTHPELLVPDPQRSIRNGCFVHEAFRYNPDNWDGQMMYSLGVAMGFSLDTPWEKLPEAARNAILYGIDQEKITIVIPPEAKEKRDDREGKEVGFGGIARRIERGYRWYRQRGEANSRMEEWLDKVMVERTCPDCNGSRLRATRLTFTIAGKNIYDVGELNFDELQTFLRAVKPTGRSADAGRHILNEIRKRVELLMGIGLDYLNFNRRSGTLSGGESQRIRLSTQIGSGLMGMLYVLDEPSIGLHPKDNVKMIATLETLRDLGNTVVVVEHDEETIRAADWLIEIGPGPGVHGGEVVAQGPPAKALGHPKSLTGAYLRADKRIEMPANRRAPNGQPLRVRGARHNNLQNLDVEIPLGVLVCVTGASGSGKSSLVHDIVYKRLASLRYDSRILAGAHDALEGHEAIDDVIDIDQSAIGRSPRSNPATYVGVYDAIRELFAQTDEAKKRGFGPATFSFNVKGGRCEECAGDGTIVTQLSFMPDVEVTCPACKGRRYREETLEVTWQGRNIAEVLKLSIEESVGFFREQRPIVRKLQVLHELGLGYLELGHAATILSGGEAQRVKLAAELGKMRRGRHNLYILDEPTTGLHLADIQRLLDCIQRLVEAGHSVVVIEHHLDVIKCADWVIDLGPEGGHQGGRLIIAGTPEAVAKCAQSHTGKALRKHLKDR